jgi:hypothetical protein
MAGTVAETRPSLSSIADHLPVYLSILLNLFFLKKILASVMERAVRIVVENCRGEQMT